MYIDDKFHGFLQQNYVNHKMFPELQEIVKLFRPEVIWSDGEWEAPDEYWRAKEFLAWLYNESPVHETVVANDRWGISTLCRHGDVYTCTDRYNPGVLQKHKFENAMTIDKKSWGHRDDAKLSDFFSSEELIKEIVSTIAINGNILINVGPTKYGTIEAIFADRLRDMGKWLKINGKGIYGSRPWVYQRDGNTTWFTMNAGENRDSVFVFVTDYPYDTNTIVISKVGKFMDKSSKIFMLGYDEELEVKFNKFSLRMYFKLNYLISVPIYKFT
jgi:alpha-L-fucosidase